MNLQYLSPTVRTSGYANWNKNKIVKYPTREEYDQVFETVVKLFAENTAKLAKQYLSGVVNYSKLWAQTKALWLWFYALNDYNPELFAGNTLSPASFWAIAEQVYNLRKTT